MLNTTYATYLSVSTYSYLILNQYLNINYFRNKIGWLLSFGLLHC